MKPIDILLSTYQSERFLREQLDSLLQQTATEQIRVLIRDDGSSDATVSIIREYAEKYPEQIVFSSSSGSNLGLAASFGKLVEESKAPYLMFCDHDDVWLPGKVQAEYEAMKQAELENPEKPILVYTDLVIADQDLRVCTSSKFTALKQRHTIHDPACTIICNVISGCTMMFNRALKNILMPFPSGLLMHDSYVHIAAASANGKIVFVPGKWILWRQTGNNSSATGSVSFLHRWNLLRKLRKESRIWKSLLDSCADLSVKPEIPEINRTILHQFSGLQKISVCAQIRMLLHYATGNLSIITILSRILMLRIR